MNIFYTNKCPYQCARNLDDKRVVKMVLETAQILSTALKFYEPELPNLYKSTHVNHPCSIWARQNQSNYMWLLTHFEALCDEYTQRYKKIHKSQTLLPYFTSMGNIRMLPQGEMTTPPNVTGEFESDNVIESYNNLMLNKWLNDVRTPTFYGKVM